LSKDDCTNLWDLLRILQMERPALSSFDKLRTNGV